MQTRESDAGPADAADLCPHCGGLGWVIDPDGGNGAARPCDCRKRAGRAPLLERARIPEHHRHCRLDNFYTGKRTDSRVERETQLEARHASELYVDRFLDPESGRYSATGLIYVGPPGTGKTHLAAGVLVALIERYGVHGRFVNVSHLLYQIQSTFDRDSVETKSQILEPITRAEVLVLDELGAIKPSDWVQDMLYLLINERYIANRPTIFTSNYRPEAYEARRRARPAAKTPSVDPLGDSAAARDLHGAATKPSRAARRDGVARPEMLEERVSPQVASRIYEMARPIVVGNRDYRRAVMMPRRLHGH